MTEVFTDIKTEVLINGAWLDLSADVVANPAPHCLRGFGSNDVLDHIADPGRLTFSLKNGIDNSAGLLGYYSPGHANALSGWTTGLYVRQSFEFDGLRRYKFFGKIEPNGITPIPGIYAKRRVEVSCYDWMGQAAYMRMDLLTQQTNLDPIESIQYILSIIPYSVRPQQTSFINPGYADIPTVFDVTGENTTLMGELNKIAESSVRFVAVTGDGTNGETLQLLLGTATEARSVPVVASAANTMIFEDSDVMLFEDGDTMIFSETAALDTISDSDMQPGTEMSYGKDLANFITVTVYPRRVDAAATTVLWTLEQATQLASGASITLRGTYRDPAGGASRVNCASGTAPVASTDYFAYANSDGTGTNYTANLSVTARFGSAEVEIVITNNAVAAVWFGGADITFQVRGKGVYSYDTVRIVEKDNASIAIHGVRPLNNELKYEVSPANGQNRAVSLLGRYSEPLLSVDKLVLKANKSAKLMYAFLCLEPGDGLEVGEPVTAISDSGTPLGNPVWTVQSIEYTIVGGERVEFTLVLKDY